MAGTNGQVRMFRRDEIPARIEMFGEAQTTLEERRTKHKKTAAIWMAVALAAGVTLGLVVGQESLLMAVAICTGVPGVMLAVWYGRKSKSIAERQTNLQFSSALLATLRQEVHPRKRMRLVFSGADESEENVNVKRTARSPHGNHKTYYSHRWFRFDATLADGSRVRVQRKRKVKTKEGSRMHNHRFLEVQLLPFAATFDHGRIDRAVNEAITASFHNPPEGVQHRAIERAGRTGVRVEVFQMDAEFLAQEVAAVLQGLYAALQPVAVSEVQHAL